MKIMLRIMCCCVALGFLPIAYADYGLNTNIVSTIATLEPFDSIHAKGDFNLEIVGFTTNYDVRLLGDKEAVNEVTMQVKKGVLYIKKPKTTGQAVVIVQVNQLRYLSFSKGGTLLAAGLFSNAIDISLQDIAQVDIRGQLNIHHLSVKNSGPVNIVGVNSKTLSANLHHTSKVTLAGVIGLQQLTYGGDGEIELFWIDSPQLQINGGHHAKATLAGVAGQVDVNLHDNAVLNARYLRAESVYVKTSNNALAMVRAAFSQNGLARDNSNIYYYRHPFFRADHMMDSGSILAMH